MRFNRGVAIGATVLSLALVAGACGSSGDGDKTSSGTSSTSSGPKPSIKVGAFNFSESAILANMYAKALAAKGYKTSVRANLGNREVVAPALEKGEIDLYAGYAATDLEFFNKAAGQATGDAASNATKLNAILRPKGLEALEPSPAADQNSFAVTKATADKYKLKTLSDVAPVAGQLVLGGPPECPTRPFCQPGLEKTYGLKFKSFRPLDPGGPLTKAALEKGDIDIGLVFSSDGAIVAKNWVVLDDNKHLQNADNVIPLIRTKVATTEVKSILNDVDSKLTTDDLTKLNKRADVDKEDPDALAQEWLKDHGFI